MAMTTYDDQDPEQDAPAWLVWPLRVAALVIVTPLQLLGVARRSIGIALERLGSSLRRGVRAVGRALIACWWALDRGLRAVGRMVGGALRGLGRLLARLVRTGGGLLRGTRWVFRATAPLWRALRRAAVATLPLWRRLGAWLGALVR